MVSIEIDGEKLEVPQGQMIIEAADSVGIAIPRFCYHKKLSIAANCRMCLVDVEKAPKPMPACATPVTEGMKVFTKSQRAVDAQKAVMEFLLINHPLDCPICDQGGQCELQDVALEYGKDYSRFDERKRVVKDKNIGPLISTDMTRCIHCTRCVRFGTEIAGERELGATGRGEFMEIGTYLQKSVNSELSGNVIDLCPVGALTSKPFRFQARAWELKAEPSVSPHDCVGSHVFFHTHRQKVMRALPRTNETLNEMWLSDRDRFGYEGFNHTDRLTAPWIKRDGNWVETDWPTALSVAVEKLQKIVQNEGPEQIGALVSPNATLEEFYLLQKLLRTQGCNNIDHRLRQVDNSHQDQLGLFPSLGITLPELEHQEIIVVVGSDVRKEQPIINHRIRKATLHGSQVFAINPISVSFNFAHASELVGEKGDMIQSLQEVLKAAMSMADKESLAKLPADIQQQLSHIAPQHTANEMATALMAGKKVSIILGNYAWSHPAAHQIYWLSRALATLTKGSWGEMSNGANSAGGWIAGAIPHRLPFGQAAQKTGLSAIQMLETPRQGMILLHCEPGLDCATPRLALSALEKTQAVVALTAFDDPQLRQCADVLLPVTPISEMAGTYINAFGDWHHFKAAVTPLEQSRPAWKVLRVMANLWEMTDFTYQTNDEIINELQRLQTKNEVTDTLLSKTLPSYKAAAQAEGMLVRLAPTPLYSVDGVARRSHPLQETEDASIAVRLHSSQAKALNLQQDQKVVVMQDGVSSAALPVEIDDRVPVGTAVVPASTAQTQSLGAPFGMITLKPA